ncbi:DUF1003 domain-containing protein [Methanococcoides sp. SA1]|nr:DUF1003 domain-containing protein [Methanococcoides sp. SA1]
MNNKKGVSNSSWFSFSLVHGRRSFSERAADALAAWAGSWVFILGFLGFLGLWMAVNVYAWVNVWDPYPFILLNLVLSCVAALQAPVILMSQNRQAKKDRMKAEYDYKVNRRAERMIEKVLDKVEKLEKRR